MDCVILAAGRGQRLDGIAAPFHKPLLVVNGKPLIVSAVDLALAHCETVAVVVAPENAAPINHVLGRRNIEMVVQRFPDGPGHALLRGLRTTQSKYVTVLMADNVLSHEDLRNAVSEPEISAIGVRHMSLTEASRFTYLSQSDGWCEDGSPQMEDADSQGTVPCWCGPLTVNRVRAFEVLARASFVQELKIGPHLNKIFADDSPYLFTSQSMDIGVPEALS